MKNKAYHLAAFFFALFVLTGKVKAVLSSDILTLAFEI